MPKDKLDAGPLPDWAKQALAAGWKTSCVSEHWRLTAQSRTQAEQAYGQELTTLRDKIRDAIQRRKVIKNDVPGVR